MLSPAHALRGEMRLYRSANLESSQDVSACRADPCAELRPLAALKPGAGFIATFHALWPYLWPADRADLRKRVVLAFVLLVIGRVVLMGVPFTFKWATDALANTPSSLERWLPWLVGAPLALTVLYGLARVGSAAFIQARDALFAPVFMHAVRTLALQTFGHLHHLSLRFHLERKTGGLTRVLERGRNGIEEMVRLGLNQLVPVIVEVTLIIAVLLTLFDWLYVVVLVVMVTTYMAYTIKATEWRIAIRRTMNESDTDANSKAIDSLLNYETVKYFGAEARETARYDQSMARYERNSIKAYTSLALLNFGQATIFAAGLTHLDGDGGAGVPRRHAHGRRFRADQRHADPALPAAEFHGHRLSRDQAGDARHRADVLADRQGSGDPGQARRARRCRCPTARSCSRMCTSPISPSGRS